jgi:beta-glucosidase
VKELKGFQRIFLPQGKRTEVKFTLTADELKFFNGKADVIEPGEFDVWIGPSSIEGLHGEFNIQ